jgi:hypothetical protein
MRHSCLDCVRKHIASANSLMIEYLQTYGHHIWLAVGELAQAERESIAQYPRITQKIRDARLDLMDWNDRYGAPETLDSDDLHLDELPDLEDLIIEICMLDGNKLYAHPKNSKKFDLLFENILEEA